MFHDIERRRTILIVDDSPTDVERVRGVLCSDYNIEIMTDGASALERLSSGAIPDLLLVDWVMPGVSGIEVCKFVRSARGKLATIPIILLTAQHGSEEIVHALTSGANDYVSKPFVDQELKVRVQGLISSKVLLERAENAETEVRTLLMSTPDPIFAIDHDGKINFVNDGALQVLGRSIEEVIGADLVTLIPDFSKIKPGVLRANPLPVSDIQIGERIFAPSIRVLPSATSASTTIALRDVTERRRDEARRLDFYSVIAHDLRTPITSILMRVQLASRGKHGVLAPGMMEDLKKIESSLRTQVGMVNDFLELAKLEGVGYKLEWKPVSVAQIITETMDDFQPLLEKSNLTWKNEVSSTEIFALGDKQRLMQVLSNLIGNAIKFTPGPGTITTRVSEGPNYVDVCIADSGRGIAEDELKNIFQRFTRARESQNETIGTGLGLMIVREIIEAHGGEITVTSKLGEGSQFRFRLPKTL